jgi:two-component system sensor histidine kinase KdpD
VGLSVASAAFLIFDFVFLPPYNTFVVANPLDWLVLAAFMATAAVAAYLLDQARRQADEARHRSTEVERLAALGAEALNAPRAELAVTGIESVIRETLPVSRCIVHRPPPDGTDDLVAAVLQQGVAFSVLPDGTTRSLPADPRLTGEFWSGVPVASTRLLLPLRAGDRVVGALELAQPRGFTLDAAQQRLLDAMTYYAALGVERIRLEAGAAHAAALEEADRLKDNLIASVSHDIRTPLTTIKALAHGMQSHGDERADIIEQEADRLNRMVGDLLDLSRLSAGGLRLALEPVPVDELVTGAVQQVEGALGGRQLDVSLGDDGLLVGRFDLVYSIRILVNLIENARKYAPPDAPIDVTVARVGPFIEVRVADRGPGVPPNEVERIFQPLYRPEGAPPDRGSAGLGLAIARQFAEAQGGNVSYAAREGGGSVFTLRLPVAALAG